MNSKEQNNTPEQLPKVESDESVSELDPFREYILNGQVKASGQIYSNLGQDPMVAELVKRKRPSYRELLFIASTVISGLDNEIARLRPYEKTWNRMGKVVNAPMFSSKTEIPEAISANNNSVEAEEANWILKYLTLRNLGSTLLIVVTLAAGFFAWLNKDYTSLLDQREKRVTALVEETKDLKAEKATLAEAISSLETQIVDLQSEVTRLEGRETAANQKYDLIKAEYDSLKAERIEQSAVGDQERQTLNDRIATLTEENGSLRTELATAKGNESSYKRANTGNVESLGAARREIDELEVRIVDLEADLNNSVDAWNDLLGYLYEKDNRGRLDFRTSLLKTKLKNLERLTANVDGMKTRIQ